MHLTDPLNDERERGGLSERQLSSIRAIVYLAILVLVVVFGLVKLWQMPMTAADFKFTDVVVVGLAMFAIWLSVSIVDRMSASLREMCESVTRLQERLDREPESAAARSLNHEHVAGLQR